MSGIQLKKLLQTKKAGEQWHCIHAPEETMIWGITNPWPTDLFESRDVIPQSIRVTERVDTDKNVNRFSLKHRKTLKCGLEITKGEITTGSYTRYNFTLVVDDTIEFNQAMKELSLEYGIKAWDINFIRIYGKGDALISFELHNPDSNGTGLYLYKAKKDGETKLYPEIAIGTQLLMVGEFREHLAQCVCTEELLKSHGCARVFKATKEAMKKKMTGKWAQLT